jgi:C4-type Zn-finger protein
MTKKFCDYKGIEGIDKKYEWCYIFNAEVQALDCKKCGYKNLSLSFIPTKFPEKIERLVKRTLYKPQRLV